MWLISSFLTVAGAPAVLLGWSRAGNLTKHLLHRVLDQKNDRKDTKHRAERHEHAFDSRHDETEHVMLSLCQEAAVCKHKSGENPSEGNEHNRHDDKHPA